MALPFLAGELVDLAGSFLFFVATLLALVGTCFPLSWFFFPTVDRTTATIFFLATTGFLALFVALLTNFLALVGGSLAFFFTAPMADFHTIFTPLKKMNFNTFTEVVSDLGLVTRPTELYYVSGWRARPPATCSLLARR